MNVTRKDAEITNVGADDEFPGSFQVVLSTPAKDRDGDELATEDWKQPLPEHITFDIDHGMSVEKTVGSGKPSIDEQGRVIVDGTYSSLQKAQDTRTLVKEGHIRTVSVAFMSEKVTKDGKTKTQRELLNGAFVAIPSNREAVVLASKGIDAKAGARHSSTDMAHIQSIHDHALALGATPADDTGAATGATGGKEATVPETKTLDAALTALAAVDVKALPPTVVTAVQALMDAIEASEDETEDNETEETTPPTKTVDADALTLQYRAIEIAALAG